MLWLLWVLLLSAALVLYFWRLYSRFSDYGVRHLNVIPPVGNLLDIAMKRGHFVDVQERNYFAYPHDRFVGFYDFLAPFILIRDIDLIKKIVVKDFDHFVNHRDFIDKHSDPLFGRNLFSLKDDEWKDMRSTLSPAFTSSKIRLMVPFMVEVGEQMIKSLQNQIKDSGVGYVDLECRDLGTRYGNDVIASCAFGLKIDSYADVDNPFYTHAKAATLFGFKTLMKIFISSSMPRFARILKLSIFTEESNSFFRDLVMNTMKNREANNIIRPDMIHLLMEAKKGRLTHDEKAGKDSDAGFATVEESSVGRKNINRAWTDDDLTAQAVVFFIAGFESVSVAMCFLLYELSVQPDIQERLYKELRDNEVKNKGKFDYNSVQGLKYLDMVVSEALRLWPAGHTLDRKCTKPYNLGRPNKNSTQDYIIQVGEGLHIPVWAIHRDPQYYPDPLRFDPERFSDENKHNINPWTYIPFGLGPRNCIGSRFALCEVKVMTYQLLLNFQVDLCEKTVIPPRICPDSFNLRNEGGAWIRVKDRN